MSSGGGGSSIFAAYAVIRNAILPGRAGDEDGERAALDAEELREVEYTSMGLAVPKPPMPTVRPGRLQGLLRSSRVAAFRRSK
jgi:hypothetical protein